MNLAMMLALMLTTQSPSDSLKADAFNLVGTPAVKMAMTERAPRSVVEYADEKPPVVSVPVPTYTKTKIVKQEAPTEAPEEPLQQEPGGRPYRVVRRYVVNAPVEATIRYSAPSYTAGPNCANGSCSVPSSSSMSFSAAPSCSGGNCGVSSSSMSVRSFSAAPSCASGSCGISSSSMSVRSFSAAPSCSGGSCSLPSSMGVRGMFRSGSSCSSGSCR